MIKTPILKRTGLDGIEHGIWVHSKSLSLSRWEFCGSTLQDLFEIPATATRLQIVAYDRRAKGRMRVVLEGGFATTYMGSHYILSCTRHKIRKVAGIQKLFYIDVYYWEDEE